MHRSGRTGAVAADLGKVSHPFAAMFVAGDNLTERSPHSVGLPDRRSACPGLFRIVPSRDGGICRIKLGRGIVTSAQLRGIALAAERHGSPAVEATNRANIQIRGVRAGAEEALVRLITEAGLGPRSNGADDVRNVMVSPTAGIDPLAITDVTGLADRVLARLEAEPAYHLLSPKFSLQIDGGESVAMISHPNDVWFAAIEPAAGEPPAYAIGLAGSPPVAGGSDRAIGIVAAEHAEDALFATLDLFLSHVGKVNRDGIEMTRMRHLLADLPPNGFADLLAARLPCALQRGDAVAQWRRRWPDAFAHIGQRAQRQAGFVSLGAVPPLGRMGVPMLRGLADLADTVSAGEIRMTPWQGILLPHVAVAAATAALNALARLGFLVDGDRPLAAMVTCAGSMGCRSGLADTKTDALTLSALLDERRVNLLGIHLTGCGKSCAAPRPAPVTLLGISPGHYDLFLRTDIEGSGFGKRIGADLTIDQAGDLLANQYSRVPEQER